MVKVDRPPANRFVAFVRRIYNPVGFSKGYNFVLWFILAGALMGFVLARFMYLDIDGISCYAGPPDAKKPGGFLPSDCYHYAEKTGRGRIGILLHLAGVLPGGFLVVFQFVPVIRHKLLLFHRINGYVIILLSLVSTAGVIMIAGKAFNGGLDTQVAAGVGSIMFIGSQAMAYYNIKKLQIEQHRAWMLRAWINASFIITMRLISSIINAVQKGVGQTYYLATPCYVVDYMFGGNQTQVLHFHPLCESFYSGANQEQRTVTVGGPDAQTVDQFVASYVSTSGAAAWLALAIHVFAVEVYLRLTPAEGERLRRISYQRQLEAGMRNPGNEGLTAQRLGDAEAWDPTPASSSRVVMVEHKQGSTTAERESNDGSS
jgi:hypothetical protein